MKYQEPIVSVILPTYNRADIIERSIRSVLQQTFTNFELLIVDDASIDNTDIVVKNIEDPRIKYIKCVENKGANAARNIGIQVAQCDYIAFQDSDDEWYIDKLEKQIKIMQNSLSSVGVVYSGYWRVEDNKKTYIPTKSTAQLEGDISSELLKQNFIGTPTMLIRKECFKKVGTFDEKLPRFQDWELAIRLSKHYHFKYINEATMNAYIQTDSLTSNQQAQLIAYKMIFEKYYNDFSKDKKLLIRSHENLGIQSYLNGNDKEGKYYLWKAYKVNPLNFKLLLKYILILSDVRIYKKVQKTYQFLSHKQKKV
ncbi:glycosyltransferase [Sulfurovum sp.]|uniref:glycosyltransferase family 2 protein n=1 Tax=Sulfurovum sp. TaxID=1969726 RepID=UPI002867D2E3|nr:glycosyltransferase [Sulfurovum sp.]